MQVGVIGFGVGEQHARAYAADPRCRVTAICDVDPAKQGEARALFPEARVMHDASELIGRGDVDTVSIASPDDAHHGHIMAALRAGKHVFVEKPVCLAQTELDAIRKALEERPRLKFSSNLVLRMSPRFMDIRARVARGEIGTPYYLEADYCYGRIHKLLAGWRGRIPGYSVMLGGGVHVVDQLLWIVGKPVVKVAAFGSRLATRESPLQVDDLTVALLHFADGEIAKVSANFASVMPHFHRFIIYGTEGTIENEVAAARLWTSREPDVRPQLLDTPYPGVEKGALIRGFVDAIVDGGKPPVPPEDIFNTMAVCFAIDAAKAAGRIITVDRM